MLKQTPMLKRTMTAAALTLALGAAASPSVAQDVWDDRDGVLMQEGAQSGDAAIGGERRLDVPQREMIPEGGIRNEDEDDGAAATGDRNADENAEGFGDRRQQQDLMNDDDRSDETGGALFDDGNMRGTDR